MSRQETPLQQAERHVVEDEERVVRQRAIVEDLARKHHAGAAQARRILDVMEETLRLAREHLEIEQLEEAKRCGNAGADR